MYSFESIILLLVVVSLLILPALVIWWKLYVKGGQPGWAIIVPGYGYYAMGMIAKQPTLAVATAVLDLVCIAGAILTNTNLVGMILNLFALPFAILVLIQLFFFIKSYDVSIFKWALFIILPVVGVFFVDSVKYKSTGFRKKKA